MRSRHKSPPIRRRTLNPKSTSLATSCEFVIIPNSAPMDSETQDLVEKTPAATKAEGLKCGDGGAGALSRMVVEPAEWIRMLCRELNGSFVFGVVVVYGLSQGFASSFFRVVSDYYWKDVQRVQPSAVQFFIGLYYLPWIMKPVWGLLTDVVPVRGYRRRPYFIAAGVLGVAATFVVATFERLAVAAALLCLVGMMAGVAIADVTIDACIARNSIERPGLAADMQSLCGFVSSAGALVGFSTSGVFVHLLGAQGALGLMALPATLLIILGFVIYEHKNAHLSAKPKVWETGKEAIGGMARTIQFPTVWKPSLYMFLSLALSISTHEGQFYWYTDRRAGPAFSQEFVGMIYAIGATASMVGVLIYHKLLKHLPFRRLIFFAQLLYGVSGMLDLAFVLRWNLKLRLPDAAFVVLEECVSRVISRLRWMPMMVLSTRLCPRGIEGTFFALLMCIDSLGTLTSKTAGGLLLHFFSVTRTDFRRLWLVLLLRNLLRIATLGLIFLVPSADPNDALLPPELMLPSDAPRHNSGGAEEEALQLAELTDDTDTGGEKV
ncbi:probable folate-biopterin transporter 6 [Zingiber officinale]|nr:probable folate-biopterin transporter 6 [Zingiber officinale]